ncbi:Eco57I restriction-modification methylase domain-containing protein [Amylibacter sp.]|nr:Eco57I restriction-modification methylase domain-containing protein [Amylibacter sp.]
MSEQASFTLRNRNPDVLTCIANLSNDEVFTPPELANQMLDSLTQAWAEDNNGANLWEDRNVKFLDPCTKSGVFLREITTRLTIGLKTKIPNLEERVEHILSKQVFGIGITKLTSLLARRSVYCSKNADGEHSIAKSLKSKDGNIWYENLSHSWIGEKCKFCGAKKGVFERTKDFESHAYAFIHTSNIRRTVNEIFGGNMQFDVIIGNPPYQLDDGGFGMSAAPIYQLFVEQAKSLEPKYLSMVIPARWYAGGKGLDEFRQRMLNDDRIRRLIDFENSADIFPGVDIAGGICYFLWDRDNPGLCDVANVHGEIKTSSKRLLNEFSTLIRHSKAVPIIRKIQSKNENNGKLLSQLISPRKPFGLQGNYSPKTKGIPCWFTQRIGLKYADKSDIKDNGGLLQKWKLLIPRAPIAGQTDFTKPVGFYYGGNTRIAKPGECCTESYLVACAFDTENEVISFRSYLFTKIVRFLLLQKVVSQDVTREKFSFVPDIGNYQIEYTDSFLRKRWMITDDEWNFIDSKIKSSASNDE